MSVVKALFAWLGRPIMFENCHQGAIAPGMNDADNDYCTGLPGKVKGHPEVSDCPFTFWRTTGDPGPDWGTVRIIITQSLRRCR